ncbi:MAG: hypothetical protein OEU92_16990 [Alphaproteobacteria bacterium]|nr:hypothetical protein [Alphaproteobacteria bacterium]
MAPGISFHVTSAAPPADPNRMDIALFVGFLPLRGGEAAARARGEVEKALAVSGWQTRVGESAGALLDLPVRVKSLAEVEALFDTGGRLDRTAVLRGLGLDETVEIAAGDTRFAINLDGVLSVAELAPGPMARDVLRAQLDAVFADVAVTLGAPDVQGRAALVLTREPKTEGAITVYTNPSVGFVVAQKDETRLAGCPMGVALRSFFAAGGREAVILRLGDPIDLFAREADRVRALETLIGGGYGAGAASLAALLEAVTPALPGAFPTRDPWHGLAHLHGLEDVAMALLPDLAELTSTVPPIAATPAVEERPPERFTVCAAEPAITFDGEAKSGAPARADGIGLELFSRLAAWAVEQTARITPEVMVIASPPLPVEAAGASHPHAELLLSGNAGAGLAHPQLQVAAPWILCADADDMPGRAGTPDGLLAGTIAARTLADGAWRTVAGTRLPRVVGLLGEERTLTPTTAPGLSLIGRNRFDIEVQTDSTTSPGIYSQANIRRLVALVLRAARHRGESAVFDANGPLLWRDVAMVLTSLLRRLHGLGALKGVTEDEAFTVLCGPETMRQSDIDAGRVIAEVALRPTHTLETIEISFVERGGALAIREAVT